MARPNVDIAEWREMGGLQEANRLFFHPHGWALSVLTVTKPWSATDERVRQLADALRAEGVGVLHPVTTAVAILNRLMPVGTQMVSDIWEIDPAEDAEGIVFGEDPDDKQAKADRVLERRRKFYDARCSLFGVGESARYGLADPDIEPIDWVLPEDSTR